MPDVERGKPAFGPQVSVNEGDGLLGATNTRGVVDGFSKDITAVQCETRGETTLHSQIQGVIDRRSPRGIIQEFLCIVDNHSRTVVQRGARG